MVVSAMLKGMDPVRFSRTIELIFTTAGSSYAGWQPALSGVLSAMIILVELLLGAMLVSDWQSAEASLASLVLLCVFTIFTYWSVATERIQDCGCFGMIVERSPLAARIENVILVILALVSCLRKPDSQRKISNFGLSILGVGSIWLALCYVVPMPWSVVRVGSTWKAAYTQIELGINEHQFVWMFDVNCVECQEAVEILETINDDDHPLLGLTSATPGRFDEFIYDFEPDFPIFNISSEEMKRVGVPSGSLVEIVERRVDSIVRIAEISDFVNKFKKPESI